MPIYVVKSAKGLNAQEKRQTSLVDAFVHSCMRSIEAFNHSVRGVLCAGKKLLSIDDMQCWTSHNHQGVLTSNIHGRPTL